MQYVTLIICLVILVLFVAVPVNAAATVTISSVSPSVGYADGETVTYTITGVNFTVNQGTVRLERSGQSDISGEVTSWTAVQIVCRIRISTTRETGPWTLVVEQPASVGGLIGTKSFAVIKEMTLTSITPKTAQAENESVSFTIKGTGLTDVEKVYLYNSEYDTNITADDVSATASKVEGVFDLTDAEEDTYDVCVEDSNGIVLCDLSFEISTNEVGSIDVSSTPIGASVYVDGTLKGTTPMTVDNLVVGSHRVILKKSGYQEWGKMVNGETDDTASIDATLYAITTYTATPPPTTWVTARPTTKATVKSTLKVPTSWDYVPATTTSPVDPLVIVIASGIGSALVLFRRR